MKCLSIVCRIIDILTLLMFTEIFFVDFVVFEVCS